MTALLQIALANAVVVVPLAAIVWGISRWLRRPAFTHAVWLVVLVKLITPPCFHLSFALSLPSPVVIRQGGESTHAGAAANSLANDSDSPWASTGASSGPSSRETGIAVPDRGATNRLASSHGIGTASAAPLARLSSERILYFALLVWGLGSIVWLLRQAIRGRAFWTSVVRTGMPHAELQNQAQRLATHYGLNRCPRVIVVDATVSPMLWGYGLKMVLLFPAELLGRIDGDARATLLAHELAHYRRGDHWVRVLELIVTALYWWHPIVWLARHAIEQAEEECCDAWVVTELPHTPRRYAEALLDTIDFLCDTPSRLPPVATGLGQAPFLRKRLAKIIQGVSPKRLSRRLKASVALIAALSLTLQPFVFGSVGKPRPAPESPAAIQMRAGHSVGVDEADSWEPTATSASQPAKIATQSNSPANAQTRTQAQVAEADDFKQPQIASEIGRRPTTPPISGRERFGRGERVWGTAVSPNGHFAISVTTARRVLLTNFATEEVSDLSAQSLTCVAFLPDGNSFVAGDADGRISVWSALLGKMTRVLHQHEGTIRTVAISPTDKIIALGCADGTARLIGAEGGELLRDFSLDGTPVNCVRFSPAGTRLAIGRGDWLSNQTGHVAVYRVGTSELIQAIGCESAPGAISFVSNDELIVGLWNGDIGLWNLANRRMVGSAVADKGIVAAASFSPDNPLLREATFVAPALDSVAPLFGEPVSHP